MFRCERFNREQQSRKHLIFFFHTVQQSAYRESDAIFSLPDQAGHISVLKDFLKVMKDGFEFSDSEGCLLNFTNLFLFQKLGG